MAQPNGMNTQGVYWPKCAMMLYWGGSKKSVIAAQRTKTEIASTLKKGRKMTDSKEITIPEPKRAGLAVLGSTEHMQSQLKENQDKITMVHEFVEKNFTQGIDFGPADPRNPKPTLLKPGAEKVVKLFNTRPVWSKDTDTWEMLGSPKGTICYKCEIISNVTGEIVGEGRGAEKVGNKSRDANKAIKIAEKCALMDAVLYTFGLSDRFTQDGGKPRQNTNDELEGAIGVLTAAVEDLRIGIDSTMTDHQFIVRCCEQHIHRKNMHTIGAARAMYQAIVKDELFDPATGDRIPE